jgi:N,N'-diacetyl-8-epilegionaminate cytidylyltransferase
MAQVIACTFARGGSKGIPGKNIRALCGKPLIAYAATIAKELKGIDRYVVSTDDPAIAATAREYGAEIPFLRPAVLATDQAPEWLAWRHLIETLEERDGQLIDILISIPTTSPLRNLADVQSCLDALVANHDTGAVITVTPARRHPSFNMVSIRGGIAHVHTPSTTIHRRQDADPVFDMTTVAYAVRRDVVVNCESLFATTVRAVIVPEERALDIDTELDWIIAEALMERAR